METSYGRQTKEAQSQNVKTNITVLYVDNTGVKCCQFKIPVKTGGVVGFWFDSVPFPPSRKRRGEKGDGGGEEMRGEEKRKKPDGRGE